MTLSLRLHSHTSLGNKQIYNTHSAGTGEESKGIEKDSTLGLMEGQPQETRKEALPPGEQSESCPTFWQQYDICMQLASLQGDTYSKWEAVTHFFIQLQAADDTIQVVPWQVQDQHSSNPPIAITNITQSFFNLQTYVPCLASTEASWTTRMTLGNM